jgi:transposase
MATDGLGNPLVFTLTAGQSSDIGQANALLDKTPDEVEAVMADKGYDSDEFIQSILDRNMEPIIPPKKNRKEKRLYDKDRYKERHLIECFFGKIKHYRRVFSRFDKTKQNFSGFISFVCFLIWTR